MLRIYQALFTPLRLLFSSLFGVLTGDYRRPGQQREIKESSDLEAAREPVRQLLPLVLRL
jgi:hypothetical protein